MSIIKHGASHEIYSNNRHGDEISSFCDVTLYTTCVDWLPPWANVLVERRLRKPDKIMQLCPQYNFCDIPASSIAASIAYPLASNIPLDCVCGCQVRSRLIEDGRRYAIGLSIKRPIQRWSHVHSAKMPVADWPTLTARYDDEEFQAVVRVRDKKGNWVRGPALVQYVATAPGHPRLRKHAIAGHLTEAGVNINSEQGP